MIRSRKVRPSTAPGSQCVKCSRWIVKRTSTKILVQSGPYGVPKTLCWICNRCLPSFLDELEITMPDDTVKPYKPRRMCRKCHNSVGKYANYCQHCGADLNAQEEEVSMSDARPMGSLTTALNQMLEGMSEAERNNLINALAPPPLTDYPTAMPLNWDPGTRTRKD